MATKVLTSFAELAKIFQASDSPVVAKQKARKLINDSPFLTVDTLCGRKAAIIWAFLQEREYRAVYGASGAILNSPEEIAIATGYEVDKVKDCLVKLICHGYARYSNNLVKAA
jgi:hypothetical protein